MIIDLGEWTPDRPEIGRGRLRVACNVRPAADGYEPMGAFVAQSDALAGRPLGAVSVRGLDAAIHTFAGTAGGLFELSTAGAWEDRTRTSTGYATADGGRWRFTTFGDRLVATNFDDAIQRFDMAGDAAFEDLANAPRARFVATFRDFLVAGHTSDNAAEVRWSAINDTEGWTAGVDQSDLQALPDGGYVTGLAAGEVLTVFQETAIRRAQYLGPPLILAFDVVERGRGLPLLYADSLAQVGSLSFYLSEDGFSVFDGVQSRPIGHERVDEWFRGRLSRPYADRISVAVDPLNKLVGWAYPSIDGVAGALDELLIYQWAVDRWAYAKYDMTGLAPLLTRGLTLDELDGVFPGGIDAHNLSVDDASLSGGASRLGGFNGAFQLGYLTGAAQEAVIQTDDLMIAPGMTAFVRACRPMIDAAVYVAIGVRDRTADAVVIGAETLVDATGAAPQRAIGRYVRVQMRAPAGAIWTKAQGLELDLSGAGIR